MPSKSPKHIALLTGFSGAGKTTLWKELIALHPQQLNRVVTYTTRNPREGEQHGVDYHFLTTEDFLQKQEDGHFLESSQHYGHHYGSPTPDHLILPHDEAVPFYVIDPAGGVVLKERYPNTHAFFLYISPEEQYRRLKERATDPTFLQKRFARYQLENEVLEKNKHLYTILRNEEPEDLKNALEHFQKTLQLG